MPTFAEGEQKCSERRANIDITAKERDFPYLGNFSFSAAEKEKFQHFPGNFAEKGNLGVPREIF